LYGFRERLTIVDLTTAVSTLVAQAPLTAVAVLVLILYIERRLRPIEVGIASLESRITSLESRVASLESRVSSLDGRVNSLEARLARVEAILTEHSKSLNTLIDFGETLLSIQASKGVVSDSEYGALSALLEAARPVYTSKYYTKEAYEGLGQLLRKSPNEITWDDVFELEKIHDLPLKEAVESDRDDLAGYAERLETFMAAELVAIILIDTNEAGSAETTPNSKSSPRVSM